MSNKLKLKLKKPLYQLGGGLSASGGTYNRTEYTPFIQTETQFQPTMYISKANIGEAAPMQVPQLDLEDINTKLLGKGHTNDVNAYIGEKMAAQNKLQELVARYGNDAASIGDFSKLINKMQVNPAELNQLIVRKEMSNEYADQNKANGGQAEWVTSAEGQVFGQDPNGQYGYFDRSMIATGRVRPITSSEAIKLNDVDRALINDEDLMSKVAQTWGGEKAFKHVNENMDKLGKSAWNKAIEQLGSVDTVGNFLLYGEIGQERGGSTNARNIETLYKSFVDSMDQSALNYFKNQALERVVQKNGQLNVEGLSNEELQQKSDEYNYNTELETRKLIWDYMQKALDVSSVSKDSVKFNHGYTQAKSAGGGGPMDTQPVDFLQNFFTSGSTTEGIVNGRYVKGGGKDDAPIIPNGYRIVNQDGSISLTDMITYDIKDDKAVGRLFQIAANGFLDVTNKQNYLFAGEAFDLKSNAVGLPMKVEVFKLPRPKKDQYGNQIPGQYENFPMARTLVVVNESELDGKMVTITDAKGKPVKQPMIDSGYFSSEPTIAGASLGVTKIGGKGDLEKYAIANNLTKDQTEQLIKMADEKSGDWYLMPIDSPNGLTTAQEFGQGAMPLMQGMGDQFYGQGYKSSMGGSGSNNTAGWAQAAMQLNR